MINKCLLAVWRFAWFLSLSYHSQCGYLQFPYNNGSNSVKSEEPYLLS